MSLDTFFDAYGRTTNLGKGRSAMDQEQPIRKRDRRSRLTEEDVAQIKAHLLEGKKPVIIARYFEVNKSTIYDIRAMRKWRRVAPAANATPLSKLSKTKRRI